MVIEAPNCLAPTVAEVITQLLPWLALAPSPTVTSDIKLHSNTPLPTRSTPPLIKTTVPNRVQPSTRIAPISNLTPQRPNPRSSLPLNHPMNPRWSPVYEFILRNHHTFSKITGASPTFSRELTGSVLSVGLHCCSEDDLSVKIEDNWTELLEFDPMPRRLGSILTEDLLYFRLV